MQGSAMKGEVMGPTPGLPGYGLLVRQAFWYAKKWKPRPRARHSSS